jgi:hypothetical protein
MEYAQTALVGVGLASPRPVPPLPYHVLSRSDLVLFCMATHLL